MGETFSRYEAILKRVGASYSIFRDMKVKKRREQKNIFVVCKDRVKALVANPEHRPVVIASIAGAFVVLCVLGFVVNRILDKAYIDECTENADLFVRYGLWDDASQALAKAIKHDSKNRRALELVASVGNGYREEAFQREKAFEYGKAIDFYRKAIAIIPQAGLSKHIEDLEYSIRVPKLFIGGKPFDAQLALGGEAWERSFCRVETDENIGYGDDLLPGNVLRFKLTAEYGIGSLAVELVNEKGKAVSSNKGFPSGKDSGTKSYYCLLGLSSMIAPKEYTLRGSWLEPDGRLASFAKQVRVMKQAFRQETIALNPALTTLISTPDPRKTEERLRVARILESFNQERVFQSGAFAYPIIGCMNRVTSYYGDRRVYEYASGGGYTSAHDGYDFGFPAGTEVVAVASGRVALAREHIVSGNTIIIEHLPTVYSVYYHLSKIKIKEGDTVQQGENIAEVGTTGFSTGAHLHLSVFVGNIAVDPLFFMKNKPLY